MKYRSTMLRIAKPGRKTVVFSARSDKKAWLKAVENAGDDYAVVKLEQVDA